MDVTLGYAFVAQLEHESLLIDEVLVVGEEDFQKKCLETMEQVAGEDGRTVIFVSHNMDAICQLCARCILLQQGQIERSGNTADVVATYLGGEQDQTPVVDFTPIKSEASFRFAGLYGREDQPTTSFSASEPILLKCSFNVRRQIEGLQLSFSVFNFK